MSDDNNNNNKKVKKVKDDGARWRVVFRSDYFAEPDIVEEGFSTSGDAWVRAGQVIIESMSAEVGVQQYLPEVKSVAWDQAGAAAALGEE